MAPLSLLIKPASAGCNMRCSYCFYADEAQNRSVPNYGMMSLSTLENVLQKALAYATRSCTIAFQGGEPTLAGLDFYRTAVSLVKKHNAKKLAVQYAIQTNGYGIDREWAAFLAENQFLTGLSLDGPKELHDQYRPDAAGKGTFSKVTRAAQLLDAAGAEFNILTVVTKRTAASIGKVYSYFRRNRFDYQQYIPCLDPLGETGAMEYSLTALDYGRFLCSLFDLWERDIRQGNPVSIRYFDNLVMQLNGYPPESCGMLGHCTIQHVVEADGSVYPCDFYVLDRYRLGNLNECDFRELEAQRGAIRFLEESEVPDPACRSCEWQGLCRGGCRRDRDPTDHGPLGRNRFCEAYRFFFRHAYPRLVQLARMVR